MLLQYTCSYCHQTDQVKMVVSTEAQVPLGQVRGRSRLRPGSMFFTVFDACQIEGISQLSIPCWIVEKSLFIDMFYILKSML